MSRLSSGSDEARKFTARNKKYLERNKLSPVRRESTLAGSLRQLASRYSRGLPRIRKIPFSHPPDRCAMRSSHNRSSRNAVARPLSCGKLAIIAALNDPTDVPLRISAESGVYPVAGLRPANNAFMTPTSNAPYAPPPDKINAVSEAELTIPLPKSPTQADFPGQASLESGAT